MHLKEVLSESRGVPIPSFVAIAGMSDKIDEEGNLSPEAAYQQTSLDELLAELKWYGDALAAAR
jgi:hypothetical protein